MNFIFFWAVCSLPFFAGGVKIAFVGDTGMEDPEYMGYGHQTMEMIDNEDVDLVVDVGDFEYWGRCTETYQVLEDLSFESLVAKDSVDISSDSILKRTTWYDGSYGSTKGWEIGVQSEYSPTDKNLTIDGEFFQRQVVSDKVWEKLFSSLKIKKGDRDCGGEPWDGPWEWNRFVRDHSFDFLAVSGNAEVKGAPLYGSAEIWASHQQFMHEVYMERIYNTRRGSCHGYFDQTEPGNVAEYGERFSCYYNNNNGNEDFHFLFLGWWQGSNEHTDDGSKENRKQTIDFIEREFSSQRSQNVRWRFCIHHMTSAKLSGGGRNRHIMVLARITDACRKHGAIIISGHHHLYSRTTMLESVGTESGEDPIPSRMNTDKSNFFVTEGLTMSITTGMGGYDGGCNGNYWNATWMDKCIARPSDHRGAVIAEFSEENTRVGIFRYMNSLQEGKIVDEFQITSRLSGSNTEPTSKPIHTPTTEPSRKPTREPIQRSSNPTTMEIVSQNPPHETPLTILPTQKPTPSVASEPVQSIEEPHQSPTSKSPSNPDSAEENKVTPDSECVPIRKILCEQMNLSRFCGWIQELDEMNTFLPRNDFVTVFAPIDEAFAVLEDNDEFGWKELSAEESRYTLLFHVGRTESAPLKYADLVCSSLVTSENGHGHRTFCREGSKFQKGPMQINGLLPLIIDEDIEACNGMVHVVDNVILPNLNRIRDETGVSQQTKPSPTPEPTKKILTFSEVFVGI